MRCISGGYMRVPTAVAGVALMVAAAVVGWAGAASAADPNTFTVNLEVLGAPPSGATVARTVTCSGGISEHEVIPLASSTHSVAVAGDGLCIADLEQTDDTPDSFLFVGCKVDIGDAVCTNDNTVQFAASGSGTVTFTVGVFKEVEATVSSTSPHPGDTVQLTAAGFAPGSDAFVDLLTDEDFLPLGTFTAGPDGTLEAVVQIPDDAALGPAQLVAEGEDPDGGPVFATADIEITAPEVVTTTTTVSMPVTTTTVRAGTGTIPKTGAGTRSTGLLALTLLGLGLLALGASFQRRPGAQSSRV